SPKSRRSSRRNRNQPRNRRCTKKYASLLRSPRFLYQRRNRRVIANRVRRSKYPDSPQSNRLHRRKPVAIQRSRANTTNQNRRSDYARNRRRNYRVAATGLSADGADRVQDGHGNREAYRPWDRHETDVGPA